MQFDEDLVFNLFKRENNLVFFGDRNTDTDGNVGTNSSEPKWNLFLHWGPQSVASELVRCFLVFFWQPVKNWAL